MTRARNPAFWSFLIMFASPRRRALPLALASAISMIAVDLCFQTAAAQEAGRAEPAATADGASGGGSTSPALPEIKVIQSDKQTPAAKAAEPKPKAKPTPVAVEAPPQKPKRKAAAKPAAPKPEPSPVPATAVAEEPPPTPAPATALGPYNPALDVDGVTISPGTTLTTAGPVNGYQALSAMSSTKTATPIEQIPQSIQVVPRKVIDDQTNLSVAETVRNVSGVQGNNDLMTPSQDATRIRGFRAEQWLDGIPVLYSPGGNDLMAHVERVEVLKGPSALLYGGGSGAPVGGAVNVISKLPTNDAGGVVGLTFGSNSYLKPYFDVNQPLSADGTVLFRMTGEYKSADSFIDVLETDSYSLNPTIKFTNKTDATLTVQGRFARWEQQDYQGLPATGTIEGAFDLRRDLFFGPDDLPKSVSETQGVTVTFDRKIDDIWSTSIKARWNTSSFDQYAQSLVGADSVSANLPFMPGTSFWGLTNAYLGQDIEELTVNPNVQAKFSTGPMDHVLLIGADYNRLRDSGLMLADLMLGGAGLVDLTNPVFLSPYVKPPEGLFTTFNDTGHTYTTKGAYTQLQTSIYDRVHLMAGVRLAEVEIHSVDSVTLMDQTADERKALPRVGAVVDVLPGVSVFASYSEGLKGNPGILYLGEAKPEQSDQTEGGIKFNTSFGLSGTLALFEINRSNTPVAAAGDPFGRVVAEGEERSRGFEADLLWQPTRNLSILGSYAYVDAEYVEASGGTPAGNTLQAIPEHSGRVWVNYAFDASLLKGLSVGAGVYAASGAWVDNANTFMTDGYFTVDAKVAYETDKYLASFNVKNLTDEDYLVPFSYFGGRVAPGAERTYYGTIAYKY